MVSNRVRVFSAIDRHIPIATFGQPIQEALLSIPICTRFVRSGYEGGPNMTGVQEKVGNGAASVNVVAADRRHSEILNMTVEENYRHGGASTLPGLSALTVEEVMDVPRTTER